MFQRLNNMFVREINNLPSQEPEFSEKEEEEWILVDFIDTCSNFSMVEEEEEEEEDDAICEASPVDHSPVFSCLPSTLECLADASESCFIQFDSCPMEESWFITPPPCFTAGGLTALKVETSPLENLLIEHPSMSVYAVHNACHSLNKTSCGDEEEEGPEPHEASSSRDFLLMESCRIFCLVGLLVITIAQRAAFMAAIAGHTGYSSIQANHLPCVFHSENVFACPQESYPAGSQKLHCNFSTFALNFRSEAQNEMGQHIRCYIAAVTAHSTFLEQTHSFRPPRWTKEHNARQYLNRNCLRRQNLTRDCYSRQLKNNGFFVHQPCQRQYNY